MNIKQLDTKSERRLAMLAGVSRTSLRAILADEGNPTLRTLHKVADALEEELEVVRYPARSTMDSGSSVVGASLKIKNENFDSWKIHFFDFVDELNRSKDRRLLLLPPIKGCDPKLNALFAATVLELCHLNRWKEPVWAINAPALAEPWFVAGSPALMASALLESPLRFKTKNVYVLENFLKRA
jgi:transcriptional regulator with XRE-family HTH domain